jgi:transcriptional regulator with XRE-family HTH domain
MKTWSLREARERAKLTQDALAQQSGVPQSTISSIESDANPNPTHKTIHALAKALGIAPYRLRFSDQDEAAEAS